MHFSHARSNPYLASQCCKSLHSYIGKHLVTFALVLLQAFVRALHTSCALVVLAWDHRLAHSKMGSCKSKSPVPS